MKADQNSQFCGDTQWNITDKCLKENEWWQELPIFTDPYSGNFEKLWNRYKVCPRILLHQAILKTECRKLRHLITAPSSVAQ